MMAGPSVESDAGVSFVDWSLTFPFNDSFVSVLDGKVSMEYVRSIRDVLRAIIDANIAVQEDVGWTSFIMRTMVVSVAAMQRCQVILQHQDLIAEVAQADVAEVAEYFGELWSALVERDSMCLLPVDDKVRVALGDAIEGVWRYYVSARVCTLDELVDEFGFMIGSTRFIELSGVWVESEKGVPHTNIKGARRTQPVLTMSSYRRIMQDVRLLDTSCSELVSPYNSVTAAANSDLGIDLGYGRVDTVVYADWVWIVATYPYLGDGVCYLKLFHPSDRHMAYVALGAFPTVGRVSDQLTLSSQGICWTHVMAEVQDLSVIHVSTSGSHDLSGYDQCATIGSDAAEDYYARALVDEFIMRHKPVDTRMEPVDRQLVPLKLDTSIPSGVRRFSGVADVLYESIGKVLSPGTKIRAQTDFDAVRVASEHSIDVDENRLVELRARLAEGAAIDEGYFNAAFRRKFGARWRPRPRLRESGGRAVHLFEGFLASGGAGTGYWKHDTSWDVPGWTSYLAQFSPNIEETISFVSPIEAQDLRMDCTGEGALDFGDCKITTRTTVLWFSTSIKFKLRTTGPVDLRISIPNSGQASAIGLTLRRYLRIGGYVIATRYYDVPERVSYHPFPMERVKRSIGVGCHVYSGKHQFERGRHRLRLTGLSSTAPIKLLVATNPVTALSSVEWCGVRVYSTPLDYAGLLIDDLKSIICVSLNDDAELSMSVAQIVDIKAYEVAIQAMMTC